MNLVIDVGNTNVKLAVFENAKMLDRIISSERELLETLDALYSKYPTIEAGIVSAVGRFENQQLLSLQKNVHILELTHNLKFPFKNNYATPKTLGVDRIALVAAAVYQYPQTNVLVIDAGTCITYDFVDAQSVYQGGAISPGLSLRYKALHDYTEKLPLLSIAYPKGLIGNSTQESIHSGVVFGVVNELKGLVSQYRQKYPDLTVILTGGDSELLSNQLKNGIFANSNFLLEGLNFLLEYNS
ncbi:type III pantothenate kinase [Sediminibacter sp. Hel_I_10]|uniref:type III pantothenate kinase n=1 Tax=Sediminibacter sp. Hel_I_10 TaxID=1392490 RepID=UPI00047AD998|nr:type III pantothenate kinase [Sediminibacter sp. Hel_I_10]